MPKFDVSNFKKSTEIDAFLKAEISRICYEALARELGEDFVRAIPYDIDVQPDEYTSSTIKKGAVIGECADLLDKDGYKVGKLCQIDVTIKKHNPVFTKKDGRSHPAITLMDVDIALENGKKVAEEKAEKDRKAKEQHDKKVEADKKRREQRKAKGEGV